jgi:osmotically-inducible protein OsmY
MTENYQDSLEVSRRRSWGWITLGALLLGLMLFLCTCRDSRMIQADLWARGRTALEAKGYDPNILSMSGRDATLTGVVPTEDIKADAESVIRGIDGIRQVAVTNNLAVGDVPAPALAEVDNTAPTPDLVPQREPLLSVAVAAGTVTLSGLVGGGSKPQIIEAANELYGEANVVDNLEVADDVAEPNWLTGALGLLPQVKNEVQEGRLEASPEGITISGTALSEQAKSGLSVAAQNATGLEVQNNLVVATPELKSATFAFKLNQGKAELNGTVPEATIAPAVEAASSAVGAENVVNNLQAAADVAAPAWSLGLFGALPALAKASPDLGINVVDRNLTLTGTVLSPEARESLAKQVQDVVGADVTVANQLQVVAQTPPQLRVKITPDAVQLSGTVAQATADKAVQVAGTVSSTGSVVNQLTIGENTAQPQWLPKLIDYTPAFAKEVQEAELNVQGSDITLVGAVPSDEQKALVESNVRQAVGADPTIVNQLRVVAPVVEVQPALNIKVVDNAVTLSGNVAQDTATQMTEAMTKLPDVTVTNQLTTATNVVQPEWLPKVIGLVPSYNTDVKQAELDVKDNKITLAGTVVSDDKKTELGAAFTEAVGEGVTVVNNLQVEAAEPVALRVKVENGVAQIEGNVPEATAESVVTAVDEAPDTTVTNDIQAASNVAIPDWLGSVVNLLPDVTSEVKEADVNIEGDTITLAGVVPSEEKKTEIANSISSAAGESVEVVNNLVVEAPAPSEPVQLRVQIQDGVSSVTGNVPAATAEQVTETIDAAPDTSSVTNEIAATPNVQVPAWLPKVVDVLPEATKDIENADVNIVADTITLAGTVPTEERKAEVASTVKQAAGADVNVVNNLEIAPQAQLQVSVNDGVATLTGNVVTETAEQVTQAVGPAATSVTNTIEAMPNVYEPSWLPQVLETLPQMMSDVQDADMLIDGNTITLAGTVPSEEQKTAMAETVVKAAGEGVNVVNNLTVAPAGVAQTPEPVPATPESTAEATPDTVPTPEVEAAPEAQASPEPAQTQESQAQPEESQAQTEAPQETQPESAPVVVAPTRNPEVRVDIAGNTIRLTGTVPSAESVTAAAAPYSKETVENLLEPTADVANVAWLPKLYDIAPQVANDLNRATLVLSDTTLTIQGTAPSVAQREAIGKYVSDALSPEVTVINRLTVQLQIPNAGDGK